MLANQLIIPFVQYVLLYKKVYLLYLTASTFYIFPFYIIPEKSESVTFI